MSDQLANPGKVAARPTALLAIAVVAAMTGCVIMGEGIRGSGEVSTETRSVSGFSTVAVTNQGDLEIKIGDQESLQVSAEANLLPHITSEVRNGKLIIGTAEGVRLRPRKPIRYSLTVRALEGVEVSSSGDIKADRLEARRFSIRGSSAGDISIGALFADELTARLSSSGDVSIGDGRVDVLDLNLSSSGDFDAWGLNCREAEANLSSSGDASVWVDEKLEATLSSSGGIRYRGDPTVNARETSSGKVRRDN